MPEGRSMLRYNTKTLPPRTAGQSDHLKRPINRIDFILRPLRLKLLKQQRATFPRQRLPVL
jgi:hypothetical protein